MIINNPADQYFIREQNSSLVLWTLHKNAPLSRAQLAHKTGLNKSTVSSLVEDLLERKLIHETGVNSVGVGRPGTLLEINPQAGCIVGVEFGVDFIAVILTDFVGNILWRKEKNTDPEESQKKTLARTLTLIRGAINASRQIKLSILGLGLTMPGTVDLDEGILIFAPNLHWQNLHLREFFSQATGLRVYLENDANAAAVAEHLFGIARQNTDFLFVFAGVGIGGGLFLNGELYRGKNGYAGEIGHSPINAEPLLRPCPCGNFGCWETYVNQESILERIRTILDKKQDTIISNLMEKQHAALSISLIKQAADAGDRQARETFAKAGSAMGHGFASLINIFNPEKIILGGPLSTAGPYLLPVIRQTVREHSLPEIDQQVEISLSSFGTNAGLFGSVAIVVDDMLSNPSLVERR